MYMPFAIIPLLVHIHAHVILVSKVMGSLAQMLTNARLPTRVVSTLLARTRLVLIRVPANLDLKEMEQLAQISTNAFQTTHVVVMRYAIIL